jgi:pimeloyl-ACP methyl ester carboxylesterase
MRATAQRLLRFAENIGLSSFDLVATSHGGAVAIIAAAQCESGATNLKVERLVLVAPVNPYSPHGRRLAPFLGSRIGAVMFRAVVPLFPATQKFWLQRMFGDPRRVPEDSLAGYRAPLAIPGLFEHGLSIVQTWTEDLTDLETALGSISALPVFLMWGDRDGAVYASSAEPLATRFSHAEIKIFSGIGHLPYEECPQEFNRELLRFLKEQPASGKLATVSGIQRK